tara:strand:- start:177 stop:347 length:171 start_codon:yes stop_codon:yes gene_type:complete
MSSKLENQYRLELIKIHSQAQVNSVIQSNDSLDVTKNSSLEIRENFNNDVVRHFGV